MITKTQDEKTKLKELKSQHKKTKDNYGSIQGAIHTSLKFKDTNFKVRG